MNVFEFATAGRIIFGAGTFAQLESVAAGYGKRPLVVTRQAVALAGSMFTVASEPTIALVREGSRRFAAGNAILSLRSAAGARSMQGRRSQQPPRTPCDLLNYLEVIGKGQPLESRRIRS